MAKQLSFIIRNLINVDVLQKGWNRLSIRFFTGQQQQPKIELERVLSMHQENNGRDTNRFFDQSLPQYQFNEQNNTLTLIPCKIEYFKQQILYNKIFCFKIDQVCNNIYILLKLEFQHEKGQISTHAPQQYDTCYNEYICIQNLNQPSIMCHTTTFSEIHFLKAEILILLDGEGYQEKYKQTYQETIDQCKNLFFISQILHSNIVKQIQIQPRQIFVLSEKAIENKYANDNEIMLSQKLSTTIELLADTKQVNEVVLDNPVEDLDQQSQSTQSLNIEDLNNTDDNIDQQKTQNYSQGLMPSNNLQQVFFTNKILMKQPQIYEVGVSRPQVTLQKLQSNKQYTKQQMEFLYQIYTSNFINCTKTMSQALSLTQNGKIDVFFTVHGYKGSKFDLKFFSKILQIKISELGSQVVVIPLDYSNAKNTNFYELGNKLYRQLKQLLIQQFGKQWINYIKNINFIGFSQGNIVIESIITHFPIDMLIKLNMFISLNGPILSTKKQQKLTQIGQSFIKQFANKNENYCIRQLENLAENRNLVQQYTLSVPYLQQVLDYQTTLEQQQGISCMQQGKATTQESFQQLKYLDILAFNTKLFYFKKILLFGSLYDGYVNFQSETALWDDLLQVKLNDVIYLKKYIVVNQKEKYNDNDFIDKVSQRNFHIQPLVDRQSIELITNVICKNMQ